MDRARQKLERVLTAYTTELSINDNNNTNGKATTIRSSSSIIDIDRPDRSDDKSENGGENGIWFCTLCSLQYLLFGGFYFLSSSALNMIAPYLPVYFKQLGLNAQEIGIICSVQSWIAIPYTPLIGYLAEKCNIRRSLMMVSIFATAVVHLGFYFVPEVRKGNCDLLMDTRCVESYGEIKTGLEHATTDVAAAAVTTSMQDRTDAMMSSIGSNLSIVSCQPAYGFVENWYNKDDLRRLFIYLILLNAACQLFGSAWFPLSNAVVLEALGRETRNHYAYFKAFGAIGCVLSVFAGGLILDSNKYTVTHCSITVEYVDYITNFGSFFTLMVIAIPVSFAMSSPQQDRNNDTKKEYHILEVLYSLCNVRHGSVLLTVLWLSIATGKMKTFDNWYIEFLGGSYTLMAWAGLIGQSSSILTFFALPLINDNVGHIPVLVATCLILCVGSIVSAFISNPVWMIPPMFLREIAVAVYMQTSGSYFADVVESQYQASMQAIVSSVTFGIGRAIGSLMGGSLFQTLSPTPTYVLFAVVSFAFALFLLVTHVVLAIVPKLPRDDGYAILPKGNDDESNQCELNCD